MTTPLPQSARTPQPPPANVALGCKICAGRPAIRLHTVSVGAPAALPRADQAAAEHGGGAHVHQSLPDDLYVVVRADDRADDEAGQP
ncbi:hypothetical protein [Streptomyces sp. NBC_00989]|uniref:hypothetical protein n=1 Tax=Streptomyces sp. NBC_00989 TaxID=2903705 RepID=UPI002F91685F|nr:hypothetical protein OG714_55015 [Streptomyces sp. NBC_00989]